MKEYNSWPSGIRDTTEFPEVNISIDVKLRDHLEAFCKMDGVGWNEYDDQNAVGELNAKPQRLRTYRKLYEKLGLIYKKNDCIALSTLGMQIASLEDRLNEDKGKELNKIRSIAVDILSRYQLRNPCDEPDLPETCDVLPIICIWESMLNLDNKINFEEMNRVILRVMKMDDLTDAIEKIRSARKKYGNYSGVTQEVLDNELGLPVHTDQASARIAPWFSFAGWGGLLIEQQVDSDGYRNLVGEAIPYIQNAVQNPPHYFDAKSEDEWMDYYIGNAANIDNNDQGNKVVVNDDVHNKDLSEKELGNILAEMYNTATEGFKVASIHIFGIKYGDIITDKSYKAGEIIRLSGLNDSYSTELQKGINCYKCLINNTFGISLENAGGINSVDNLNDSVDRITGGENVLYYGVPGAGKSYKIKQIVKDMSKMVRVVFHPDYTYSDFVGQIMPCLIKTKDSEDGKLTYEFVPGPFTRILKEAIYDPGNMYYLVIEEINRGNAPAIFGEVFQLLDRLDNGEGEYSITNYDIAEWIFGDKYHEIRMPSNLSILATMNTSDQNVFTLDTAFQRRWDMIQIQNDVSDADHSDQLIEGSEITWGAFASVVNEQVLSANNDMVSSEDKRLGKYFVKSKDLDRARFPEKTLKYLWDDAFKMDRSELFNEDFKSLDQVVIAYETSKSDPLETVLRLDVYRKMLEESMKDKQKTVETDVNTEND